MQRSFSLFQPSYHGLPKMKYIFLFDMDGTLCDSEEIYAKAMQNTLEQVIGTRIAFDVAISYTLGHCVNDVIANVFSIYNIDLAKKDEFYHLIDNNFHQLRAKHLDKFLITPTVELFKHLLTKGYPVGVVSGSSRHDIATVLNLMGIKSSVLIVGNEDYQHGKPSPEPYLTAAKRLHLSQEEIKHNVIVIEDSPVGVSAALAAGMHVIGLQGSLAKSLHEAGATAVLDKKDIGAEGKNEAKINLINWLSEYLSISTNGKNMRFN